MTTILGVFIKVKEIRVLRLPIFVDYFLILQNHIGVYTPIYSKGIPYCLYLEIGEESISCADKVFIFRFVNTHIHYSNHYSNHFREWMVKVVREISNL